MGQQFSKAAAATRSRLGRAAASAAEEATATASTTRATTAAGAQPAAPGTTTKKQVPITHPSNTAGFQRGESGHVDFRDARQKEFLQSRSGGTARPTTEMPDDLVQFLRGAGPLQKREVKASKGVVEPTRSKEAAPSEAPVTAAAAAGSKRRRREMMPLAANVQGFDTERTTNFSYDAEPPAATVRDQGASPKAEEEEGMFDVLKLYRLLTLPPNDEELSRVRDPDVRQRIVDAQRYLEVPVIVKETEEDGFVGVHKATLETLSVPPVPKTVVRLVLDDLLESRSKNDQSQSPG